MTWSLFLGVTASILSMSSFLPQAWKTFRTGDTSALSTPMYLLTVAGFAFWTAYGVSLASWPLIVSNGFCLLASGSILTLKLVVTKKSD